MRRIGAWMAAAGAALACGRGAPPAPPPPEVRVATATVGTVQDHREYVGNVEAVNRIQVRARVRGYLLEQRYADGDLVAAGDVLFRIDPSTFDVALAQAKGELARARANSVVAQRELTRADELFRGNVTSQSQLDQRRAQRDSSAADVAAAEAKVRAAELELSYTTVPAPISGRVGRRLVDVGNLVGSNGQDTVLAEIVQIDPIHVYFAPTERDRLDVLRGAREGRIPQERTGAIPIELRLGDGTPYPHPGVIDYVDPTIEPTRGTVSVRAIVPNPEGTLKPGEFVRVTALFPDVPGAVLVPERAVLEEQGGAYVLVVKSDDTVEYRKVERGLARGGMQQVKTGLAAGERVIADGVQSAPPGTKVVPKPLEEGPAAQAP
jgi:membrane fusion protein, multidrug efflux system